MLEASKRQSMFSHVAAHMSNAIGALMVPAEPCANHFTDLSKALAKMAAKQIDHQWCHIHTSASLPCTSQQPCTAAAALPVTSSHTNI
jgi:hypothetical protein